MKTMPMKEKRRYRGVKVAIDERSKQEAARREALEAIRMTVDKSIERNRKAIDFLATV